MMEEPPTTVLLTGPLVGPALEEHEGLLEEHKGPLEEHEGLLEEHEGPLEEHEGPLEEYEGLLEEHVGLLEEHEGPLEEHEGLLEEHEGPLEEHEGLLVMAHERESYLCTDLEATGCLCSREKEDDVASSCQLSRDVTGAGVEQDHVTCDSDVTTQQADEIWTRAGHEPARELDDRYAILERDKELASEDVEGKFDHVLVTLADRVPRGDVGGPHCVDVATPGSVSADVLHTADEVLTTRGGDSVRDSQQDSIVSGQASVEANSVEANVEANSVEANVEANSVEANIEANSVSEQASVEANVEANSVEANAEANVEANSVNAQASVEAIVEANVEANSASEQANVDVATEEDESAGSISHLLSLVRALAGNLPLDMTSSYGNPLDMTSPASTSHGGVVNLAFEDADVRASRRDADEASSDDIDWSWLADESQLCAADEPVVCASSSSRPSSWLRASMRRVRRFALPVRHSTSFTQPPRPAPPDTLHPVSVSVPTSCVHRAALLDDAAPTPPLEDDFPRRYSLLGQLDRARRPQTPPPDVLPPSDVNTEDEGSSSSSNSDCDEGEEKEDRWPHVLSSLLATLGCTLGLFNVSRFAVLSVHFGANFVLQWLLLSLLIGWPLYVLHASLGQHLRAGVVDMWSISPLFQGIGVALLLSQAMLGLYSVVGVAWLFTYFRDSFINKYDAYRWAENGTRIEESVSDYLNMVVLQRQGSSSVGHLKFQVTFNLAVVWMIVFVCLSKGIKSYGKSVYLYGTLPVLGLGMIAVKVLSITDVWFSQTAWSEMFVNANCWSAAAVECFTTWGLLGAATMQMRSHSGACRLSREVLVVGLVTVTTLISAALLANGFAQLLQANDLRYVPSSFERSGVFLSTLDAPRVSSTPVRWMTHGHYVVGLQVTVPGAHADTTSGYQVAQFATELAPTVFAKLGAQSFSPFWTVLFYFTLITLGISQQLCIWHCVITGIIAINTTHLRSWETTITFLSCACGFVLGLPMTTELGVVVVWFMDYCVGGAWWLVLLQASQIIAALMAQGGERVANTLLGHRGSWMQAVVVFTWNLVLPVALTITSIAWFKTNNYRDLYTSRHHGYWPAWARRLGCLIQLMPLVLVPFVAAIQTWRYLTTGPPDLFDRLRLLCRPGTSSVLSGSASAPTVSAPTSQALPELAPFDDPPPKYTPPPSYATATGARIAKLLRRSFRRLVGPSAPSPPDYSAVLVEMGNAQITARSSTMSAMEVAHILRSSMRRTLRRDQTRSAPPAAVDTSKTAPVI